MEKEAGVLKQKEDEDPALGFCLLLGCGAPWWIKKVTIVDCSSPLFFFNYQGISLARVESRDQ